jgi:mono/diheme cytochrome c family protein
MDDDDVRGSDRPEPNGRTEQQLFDEQIARASGKTVVMFGGLGILAALVMSTVALVISAGKSTTTVTVAATPAAGQTAGSGGQAPQLKGDALGAQLFVSGKPDTGAIGCGSCHTMKAAGTSGTIGPNLDKELTADPASAARESIVDPNKEIIPGYSANVMPTNYGTALTKPELDALVNYVYHSTNAKAKRASAKTSTPYATAPEAATLDEPRRRAHRPPVALLRAILPDPEIRALDRPPMATAPPRTGHRSAPQGPRRHPACSSRSVQLVVVAGREDRCRLRRARRARFSTSSYRPVVGEGRTLT